jgi:hypothetical protein
VQHEGLRSCKCEAHPLCNFEFEQGEVLGTANAGDDQMQVVYLFRINFYKGPRYKVGLLLIVALQDNSISRHDQGFKGFNCLVGRNYGAAHPARHRLHSALLLRTPLGPRECLLQPLLAHRLCLPLTCTNELILTHHL